MMNCSSNLSMAAQHDYTSTDNQTNIIKNLDCYYKNYVFNNQLIHTVTVNPKKHKIINSSASTVNKNVAYVGEIAKKHHALIAINGGFFRKIDKNLYVPTGALKINNIWQGITYGVRASIGWIPNSEIVLIDRLNTKTSIIIGKHQLAVNYFNPNMNYLNHNKNITLSEQNNNINNTNILDNHYNNNSYTNSMNKITVYSSIYPNFNNLNLEHAHFPITASNQINYIYHLSMNHLALKHVNFTDLNSSKIHVEITAKLSPSNTFTWNNFEYITSGAPILMQNNMILTDYKEEKITDNFINHRYPRTAICILNNGFWKFVNTPPMTIPELANTMLMLQCKDAINLDGGSSTDMYLSEEILTANTLPKKIFNSKRLNMMVINPITDIIMVLPE